MLETIERAKGEDPRELRKQIAKLQRNLADKAAECSRLQFAAATKEKRVEVPVLKDGQIDRLEKLNRQFEELFVRQGKQLESFSTQATTTLNALFARRLEILLPINESLGKVRDGGAPSPAREARALPISRPQPATAVKPARDVLHVSSAAGGDSISAPQQRILDALASLHSLGLTSVSKSNVAVFADASPTSSAFVNNLGRLRSNGLIDYPRPGDVALTAAGAAIARAHGSILSLDELHRAWFAKLPVPKVRILQALIPCYPERSLSKAELAEACGASATSSAFVNNVGNLRSLGLVDYPQQGYVAATNLLFPEGLA